MMAESVRALGNALKLGILTDIWAERGQSADRIGDTSPITA